MMVYKAWADKGVDDKYRLAKWAVSQMGQVCSQLAQLTLPTETSQLSEPNYSWDTWLDLPANESRQLNT
jgi:hypothetical protein